MKLIVIARELVESEKPLNHVIQKLIDAGFDLSKEIAYSRDIRTMNYIYEQEA